MMNEKFRYDRCDCGLCEGDVHAYVWAADGQKFGPFTRSYNMIIQLIKLALAGVITNDEAIDGGMFATKYLSSSFDGEMAAPADRLLGYVKDQVDRRGHEMATIIFEPMKAEEEELAKMFESKSKTTTLRAVGS